nr:MAG: hypothetical protein [Caudoviricetes sp.]
MTMPAGSYYVGDLCYILHDEWDEVCSLIIKDEVLDGEFNLKDGRRFAIYSTQYGDGSYSTSTNHSLSVDAGCIGCILIDDIDQSNPTNHIDDGMIVEFDSPFNTSGYDGKNWDGTISFGNVKVYTGDMEEDYDEYEDEYCEDDEY